MRHLFRIIILLLFAVNANAQWQYLNLVKFGPDTLYGTYDVAYSFTGVVSTGGGDPCLSASYPGGEFWSGAGAPGGYIYTMLKPIYRIQVNCGDLFYGEYLQIYINGLPYTIQPADVTHYDECNPSPGDPLCTLSGGMMEGPGPCCSGLHNGCDLIITDCKGINTFEVYCYGTVIGLEAGAPFHVAIDTLIPAWCLQAFNNGPICEGNNLLLDAWGDSTGATYYWHGPAGYTSTSKHPVITGTTVANSGTYTVVKIVGGKSVDSETTNVIIKPVPVLTVTTNSPICYGVGNTISLFASPFVTGETFSWTGPALFSSTLQNPSRTPVVDADTGFYTVTATLNGCTNSFTTHVVYAPIPPAPGISGITTYCTGQTFVPFTVTGTGSILWYPTAVGGTGSTIAPVVSTTVAGTFSFWATQTVLGCESPRGTITVTVNTTPPGPAITGTNVYCQGDTYIPPVATGTAILWYTTLTGGTGTVGAPIINTSIPGVYTIYATQTSTGCESPRSPFVITVHATPPNPIIIANPSLYCPGQPFVPFTVFSGTGILWYSVPTGGVGSTIAPTINTSVKGVYTVYASQTVLGCESGRTAIIVTVQNDLKALFDYTIKYGCKADTVTFFNNSVQATDYQWWFGDRYSSILANPTHVYLLQALDTVKLVASVSVCADSAFAFIDLRHPVHAKFTTDTNLICQGGSITFNDAGSQGKSIQYLWEYGDNTIHAPATGTTTTHTYLNAGVYKAFLAVSDFVPCTDTMYKVVMVDTISPISLVLTDTVECKGTTITFTGIYASLGNTGITWDLGNGDSIKNVNPLVYGYDAPGPFTIKATALYRVCPNFSTSRNVTIIPQPSIDLGPDVSICKGSAAIELQDNINAGNPQASWLWNTGQTTPGISIMEPGVYTATVKVHGCYASGTVKAVNDCYMNIPNAFTPNGDGTNDYFFPHQYLSSGMTSFKISIFNRWGELVFQSNSLDGRGWDGKLNDIPQPEGVYVYLIEGTFKDGQLERHQGNVTLLR